MVAAVHPQMLPPNSATEQLNTNAPRYGSKELEVPCQGSDEKRSCDIDSKKKDQASESHVTIVRAPSPPHLDQDPKRHVSPAVEDTVEASAFRKDLPEAHAIEGCQAAIDESTNVQSSQASENQDDRPVVRRFKPQVVETSRRSSRRSNTASSQDDKEEAERWEGRRSRRSSRNLVPTTLRNNIKRRASSADSVSPASSENEDLDTTCSSLQQPGKRSRRRSFRVPDLPSIRSRSGTSEGSECSASSALWTSRSRSSKRCHNQLRNTRIPHTEHSSPVSFFTRVSIGTESRLRDQALAAFPNETVYEPVDHYAGDRDSDHDSEKPSISTSPMEKEGRATREDRQAQRQGSEGHLAMQEMQQHSRNLEKHNEGIRTPEAQNIDERLARISISDKVGSQRYSQLLKPRPERVESLAQEGLSKEDVELAPQRKAASPPMAGGDLRFPKCLSPQATRLDVHQYPGLGNSSNHEEKKHTGLWTPGGGSSPQASHGGLWMGVNAASAQISLPQHPQVGLMTPAFDRLDPLACASTHESHHEEPKKSETYLSPSLPYHKSHAVSGSSNDARNKSLASFHTGSTERLSQCNDLHHRFTLQKDSIKGTSNVVSDIALPLDQDTTRHFPDSFVTQLYNYLSFGFPTMARPYDDELSRITRIPIETLRRHDYMERKSEGENETAQPKHETFDESHRLTGAIEHKCERWKALRTYVLEWGRQNNVEDEERPSLVDRQDGTESSQDSRGKDDVSTPRLDVLQLAPVTGVAKSEMGIYGWESGVLGRKGSWGV